MNTTFVDKDVEIRHMKREMDNSMMHAREEVQREIEVGVCCVVFVIIICLFRIWRGCMVLRREGTMMGGRCVVFVC